MNKLKSGILAIIVGIVCLVGLSDMPAFADVFEINGSVTVIAVLDHITVTPVNPNVTLSTTKLQFMATANYSNAPANNITDSASWISSNTSVAAIDFNTGLAVILAVGTTSISASYGGKTDSAVLKVSADNSSKGGGGGGGGATGVTSLTEYVTVGGKFVIDATAESADGNVKLYIPKGTIGKNSNGQHLNFISIKEQKAPPTPPVDSTIIGLVYDIGPSGSTFDPPIYLTFRYSDSQIPPGVAEENLVISTWQDGKWVEYEGCVIDPLDNTITVPISHFTFFTVIAHTTPASFEIGGFTVTPAEVHPGETVTASATITNTGDLTGSYNVTLKINGLAPQTRKVTLNGGATQTISFTVTPDTTGEYTVDINGLSGKFKVKPPVPEGTVAEITVPTPASFTISHLSIAPSEVNPTEAVTISTVVTNIGGSEGSYTVVLRINDMEEARREVTLRAGIDETVTFIVAKDRPGNYTVDIGSNTGRFTVARAIIPATPVPTSPLPLEPTRHFNWELIIGIVADIVAFIALLFYFTWWRKHRS